MAKELLPALGGRVLWSGMVSGVVIGEFGATPGSSPHMVALVEYPSLTAFTAMTASPRYQEVARLRDRGLEAQYLLSAKPLVSKL